MKHKVVSLRKMKNLLDRDTSIKMMGGFYYNEDTVYYISTRKFNDINLARDYYFGLESRTQHICSEELIKDFVWNKHARHDLCNGKLFYKGLIYDGGEFAKKEAIERYNQEMKKSQENSRDHVIANHNFLIEKKAREILSNYSVKMTHEAKEKAHRISERMVNLTGPNEIHMQGVDFLDRKEDPTIRDVYISDGQIATPSSCGRMLLPDMTLTTKKLSENGQYRIAWMHSHANMPTFHSSTDDVNLRTQTSLFGKEIDLEVLVDGYKSKTKLKIYPSLVFNAKKSSPYVEIGINYWSQGLLGKRELKHFTKKNVPLEILAETNNINSGFGMIDREIREKVMWPGKTISKDFEEILIKNYGFHPSELQSFLGTKSEKNLIPKTKKSPIVSSEHWRKDKSFSFKKINRRSQPEKILFHLESGYNKLVNMYNNLTSRVNACLPRTKEVSFTK